MADGDTNGLETDYKLSVEHRLTSLDTTQKAMLGTLDKIQNNHLAHINARLDSVDKKMFAALVFLITTLLGVVVDLAMRLLPFLHLTGAA